MGVCQSDASGLSSQVKATLAYEKFIGLIALTSIFSQMMTPAQTVAVSVAVALLLGIPLSILKAMF